MDNKRKRDEEQDLLVEEFEELVALCEGEYLTLTSLRRKLEACPEAINVHGDEDTILHFACANERVTLEIVEYIVELHPESIRILHSEGYGWLPLHVACMNANCPRSVIEYLLSQYPGASGISCKSMGLPLHCLLGRNSTDVNSDTGHEQEMRLDTDLVRVMVEAYPEALTNQTTLEGKTPLLMACERVDVSLELVQMLVDPELASLSLPGGINHNLPLHALFDERDYCPPLDVAEFLIETAPETLRDRNHHISRRNPFHCACFGKNVSFEMILLFLKNGRANLLEEPDGCLNYPLHLFCLSGKRLDFIVFAAEEYPPALRAKNRCGMVPLHYATGESFQATQYLIDQCAESVLERDNEGRLPFHYACQKGSLGSVKYLFEMYPKSVVQKTWLGDLPLIKVAESNDVDTAAKARFLIQAYPLAPKLVGHKGKLPFHHACESYNGDLSLIKILFDAHPGAVHSRSSNQSLPLHAACSNDAPGVELIQFLVQELPYAIKAQDEQGRCAAHYACATFSLEKMKCLIELWPEVVKVDSHCHGLPIHYACTNYATLEMAQYLESVYPESLEVESKAVGLPLHCAQSEEVLHYLFMKRYGTYMRRRKTFPLHALFEDEDVKNKRKIADDFLEFFPEHARDKDHRGAYPLHLAVTTVTSEALDRNEDLEMLSIGRLISLNAMAVKTQDNEGSLPLHYALRYQGPLQLVKGLLDFYPESIHVVDHQGLTPLHVACSHGTSLEVVQYLVEADETALLAKDKHEETPLHKACRGGHASLVRYLFQKGTPSISETNDSGMLPLLLLCQPTGKSPEFLETPEYLEAVWLLLKNHPDCLLS